MPLLPNTAEDEPSPKLNVQHTFGPGYVSFVFSFRESFTGLWANSRQAVVARFPLAPTRLSPPLFVSCSITFEFHLNMCGVVMGTQPTSHVSMCHKHNG